MGEAGEARAEPAPIATPAKLIDGVLGAGYLNPSLLATYSKSIHSNITLNGYYRKLPFQHVCL